MHDVEVIFQLCLTEISSEIWVMPVKLQIAVSQASLIFQKKFPDAVSMSSHKSCIVFTSCNRSNIKTTKQNNLISKTQKMTTKHHLRCIVWLGSSNKHFRLKSLAHKIGTEKYEIMMV